jgi:hypothetical protein
MNFWGWLMMACVAVWAIWKAFRPRPLKVRRSRYKIDNVIYLQQGRGEHCKRK